MLTAEIRVNTALIGHLYIVNKGSLNTEEYTYTFSYYEPNKGVSAEGKIIHKRNEGALELIKKAIGKINADL